MSDRPLERWKRLRAEGGGDGVLEVPSIDSRVSTGFGNVWFAIGPEGQPRLLVPVASLAAGDDLSSTPKLAVTLARFTQSGRSTQFVDVMSLDRSLDPVFADLAVEILRRIEDGNPPVVSVTGTIQDFRELLRERQQVEVPLGRLLGLVGELTVLERMAGYSSNAVQTWMGPYELRHDFRRAVHAVEVKTSGRSDQTKVSINGSDQLAPPSGGTLALAHLRIERAEAGELSVGALYKQLLGHGIDGDTLRRGLAALDCDDPFATEWNARKFSLQGMKAYRVEDGFPRITGANFGAGRVPDGVSSLSYDVDLSHAADFEMSLDDFDGLLKMMAS